MPLILLQTPPTPIKQMLTSLPVWSVIISAVGNNWGFYTLLTIVPQYMKTIMHKDIKTVSQALSFVIANHAFI